MFNRSITPLVLKYLDHFPAVAIIGPRQSGKTTLARLIRSQIKKESTYLDLERAADLAKIEDPSIYMESIKDDLVILDEIQRRPELFPEMRSLIDRHRVPGRFLILGSASPDLIRQSSESLAGRITYIELSPLHIKEIEYYETESLWIRGGFPEPFLINDDEIRSEWYHSFISTYVERDLPLLGLNTSSIQLRKFLNMASGIQGTILNVQMLSRSMGVSSTTTIRYLDYLEKSFLIRRLQPFHINIRKRLVKSPKLYLRDTGILHSLLNIVNSRQLFNSIHLGVSWESFAIEQIINNSGRKLQAWFYRTHEGTECDLLLTNNNIPVSCIEIKSTQSPKKTRSLTLAINDLKTKHNFIIIPNCDESFPLSENLIACSLSQFIDKHLSTIQ